MWKHCPPWEGKDEYSTWLRSEKGSIKIKVLRHIGAAAIVCLSVLSVFFVLSFHPKTSCTLHLVPNVGRPLRVSCTYIQLHASPSDCSTLMSGTVKTPQKNKCKIVQKLSLWIRGPKINDLTYQITKTLENYTIKTAYHWYRDRQIDEKYTIGWHKITHAQNILHGNLCRMFMHFKEVK